MKAKRGGHGPIAKKGVLALTAKDEGAKLIQPVPLTVKNSLPQQCSKNTLLVKAKNGAKRQKTKRAHGFRQDTKSV